MKKIIKCITVILSFISCQAENFFLGPDFMVIGAMKAGSSTLYKCICQHPKIHRAAVKELHFFETDKYKELGINWYLSQFPPLKIDELTGEGTVGYIYDAKVPALIKKYFSNTKFVLLVRNPVDRAYSHYQHRVRNLGEKREFEKIVMPILKGNVRIDLSWVANRNKKFDTKQNMLRRGIYIKQIENWLKYFDRSQLLIVSFEEFIDDPLSSINEIYEFLGVDKYYGINATSHNSHSYAPMKQATRKRLLDFYRPFNKKLEQFLGRKLYWDKSI